VKFRNERAFTDAIVDLAKMSGWLVHHDRGDMRQRIQGHAGFPDLVLVKPGTYRTVIFAELKMSNGKVTTDQYKWIYALGGWCCVWRPVDWDRIVKTLTGQKR
jgi:hypothetical protein